MTEKLKNLMDEVTGMVDQDFATPDLEAIVRSGDRAVRRRRVLAGAAGVAALAVIATGTLLVGGGLGSDKADVADDVFPTDVPMWAVGSTLHTPDRTYDLGVEVHTLARTTDGIAYVGADGGVYVFSGGSSTRVGTVPEPTGPTLVADSDGTEVGWVEGTKAQAEYVVYDMATRQTQRFPAELDPSRKEPFNLSMFLAIDGSTAYWLDGRGTTVTDLDTGTTTVLGGVSATTLIISAEDGYTVRWVEDKDGGDLGTDVVDPEGAVVMDHSVSGTLGALSPDGRWAASLDDASVREVRNEHQVALDTGSSGQAIGYDWLDEDTLMVLAEADDDNNMIELYRCDVPSGDCTDVVSLDPSTAPTALPSFGLFPTLQFTSVESSVSEPSEATIEAPPATASTERP